jgi:hypothetical protein
MKAAFLSSFTLEPLLHTGCDRKELHSTQNRLALPALYGKRSPGRLARRTLHSVLDADVKAQRSGPRKPNNGDTSDLEQPQSASALFVSEIVKIAGPDRGIFALNEFERDAIASQLARLEKKNPTKAPLCELESKLLGTWRLVYTDRMILGRRRALLYLTSSAKPGLVHLGEVTQQIHAPEKVPAQFHGAHVSETGRAENRVEFRVFGGIDGVYTVQAFYGADVSNSARVWIQGVSSSLQPANFVSIMNEQRQQVLKELFDPTGYLDVTFLDDVYRVTRDEKGFVYLWERISTA